MKKHYLHAALYLSIFIGMFSLNASANEHFETGLKVGEKAPALEVIDSNKEPQTLATLSGKKGLVLVFFRSADWCPYCKRHLVEIKDWVKPLEAKGYKVAAVSYDDTNTLAAFTKNKKLNFPLLSDKETATVKAYNVLNSDYEPGDDNYGIPFPGAYIIDTEGTIKFTYFYEGYKKRVSLDKITAVLEK